MRSRALAAAGSEAQLQGNVTQFGYRVGTLPSTNTVSPQVIQKILEGKDINLAALLILYYTGPCVNENTYNKDTKPHPRLSRALTITEFIEAFCIYKGIMCSKFERIVELDIYMRDIIDMSNQYKGQGFYNYHLKFSSNAAAYIRNKNDPLDWSLRDNTLFCNIFANTQPNECSRCGTTLHTTRNCSEILTDTLHAPSTNVRPTYGCAENRNHNDNRNYKENQNYKTDNKDRYERPIQYHLGRPICNNFNTERGCSSMRCVNLHMCTICKKQHSKTVCHHDQAKNFQDQKPKRYY